MLAGNTINVMATGATGTVARNSTAVQRQHLGPIPVDNTESQSQSSTDAKIDVAGKLLPGTNSAHLFVGADGTIFNQAFKLGTATASDIVIDGLNNGDRSKHHDHGNEVDHHRRESAESQSVTIQDTASYARSRSLHGRLD